MLIKDMFKYNGVELKEAYENEIITCRLMGIEGEGVIVINDTDESDLMYADEARIKPYGEKGSQYLLVGNENEFSKIYDKIRVPSNIALSRKSRISAYNVYVQDFQRWDLESLHSSIDININFNTLYIESCHNLSINGRQVYSDVGSTVVINGNRNNFVKVSAPRFFDKEHPLTLKCDESVVTFFIYKGVDQIKSIVVKLNKNKEFINGFADMLHVQYSDWGTNGKMPYIMDLEVNNGRSIIIEYVHANAYSHAYNKSSIKRYKMMIYYNDMIKHGMWKPFRNIVKEALLEDSGVLLTELDG